jgi:hypothetical protein
MAMKLQRKKEEEDIRLHGTTRKENNVSVLVYLHFKAEW